MSRKRIKTVVAAALLALALALSTGLHPWGSPTVVLAGECESPAGGCR